MSDDVRVPVAIGGFEGQDYGGRDQGEPNQGGPDQGGMDHARPGTVIEKADRSAEAPVQTVPL